jgi:hypothetical protein
MSLRIQFNCHKEPFTASACSCSKTNHVVVVKSQKKKNTLHCVVPFSPRHLYKKKYYTEEDHT